MNTGFKSFNQRKKTEFFLKSPIERQTVPNLLNSQTLFYSFRKDFTVTLRVAVKFRIHEKLILKFHSHRTKLIAIEYSVKFFKYYLIILTEVNKFHHSNLLRFYLLKGETVIIYLPSPRSKIPDSKSSIRSPTELLPIFSILILYKLFTGKLTFATLPSGISNS